MVTRKKNYVKICSINLIANFATFVQRSHSKLWYFYNSYIIVYNLGETNILIPMFSTMKLSLFHLCFPSVKPGNVMWISKMICSISYKSVLFVMAKGDLLTNWVALLSVILTGIWRPSKNLSRIQYQSIKLKVTWVNVVWPRKWLLQSGCHNPSDSQQSFSWPPRLCYRPRKERSKSFT